MLGHEVPYLGGDVPSAVAERHVEAWNADRLAVIALHPASAGHGLNLQAGGHHLAWLGLTWSAELYQQTLKRKSALGRIYRSSDHRAKALSHWLRYYNERRPHSSLDGRSPIKSCPQRPEAGQLEARRAMAPRGPSQAKPCRA